MIGAAATLEALRRDGLYRRRRVIESAQGARVVLDGREVVLLCSNDYLGLAGAQELRDAAAAADGGGSAVEKISVRARLTRKSAISRSQQTYAP